MTTTTSTTTATTTTSHDDADDPLKTFILYQSPNQKGGCGHAVPQRQTPPPTTCPVCGISCTYLVDAVADRTSHHPHDDTNLPQTVLFKYGILVYRLTVPPTTMRVPRQQPQPPQNATPPWWSWWIRDWFWQSPSNAESTTTVFQREMTAQERIRTVLGIQAHGMKILCKGKILYPVSSSYAATATSPSDRRNEQQQEWHVSQQLLELSLTCRNNIPCLLVMGTPARDEWLEQEQQQLQRQQQQQHLDDNDKNTTFNPWTRPWHALRTVTVRDAWHWGQWLVGWSVRWTWKTVSRGVHWLQLRLPWWGGGAASSSNTATASRHEHGD